MNYSKWSWKSIYEDKYRDVSIEELKQLASRSGNVNVVANSGYKPYNIMVNRDNIDHFVGEALWNMDSEFYDSLKGYTKSATLERGFHNLLGYCSPTVYKSRLFTDEFEAIYDDQFDYFNVFRQCEVLSPEEAATHVPTESSAGVLHYGKKKGEVLDDAVRWVKMAIRRFKEGRHVSQLPYKLGLRGHLSPTDQNKTRAIWMSPVELNIMENMLFRGFYQQLFNNKNLSRVVLTGENVMPKLHEYLSTNRDMTFVNTDVSGWDHNPCRFLIKDVFYRILKPKVILDEPWKERMFEYLVESFIFTPLLLPDGSIFRKQHGVPSGSFLTLMINSIANYIVQTSSLVHLQYNFVCPKVLGDDFSYLVPRIEQGSFQKHIEELASTVFHFFKIVIKPEKVIITNNVDDRKFIGYQIRKGRLYREDIELFRGVLYPEGQVRDLSTSFTRVFAFFVIAGCNSDRYCRFFEIFLSGYYDELVKLGKDLFNINAMKMGSLRVFKHVYQVDYRLFDTFDIETFRNVFISKAPYFLTCGAKFMI